MSVLFLLVILPLAALTLIVFGAIWLTNALATQMVGNKHRLLEEIITSGEIPRQWHSAALRRLWPRPGSATQGEACLYQRSLPKLDELLAYVQTTSLVADEETRDVLVERLTEVRAQWAGRISEER